MTRSRLCPHNGATQHNETKKRADCRETGGGSLFSCLAEDVNWSSLETNVLPNLILYAELWCRDLQNHILQVGLDKLSELILAMQKLYRWLNSRTSVEVERDRYARLGSDRYARPRSRR